MFSYKNRYLKWRFLETALALGVLLNIELAHADFGAECVIQYETLAAKKYGFRLHEQSNFSEIQNAQLAVNKKPQPAEESLSLKARITRYRAYNQRLVEPQFDYAPSFNQGAIWSKISLPLEDGPIPIHDLMKAQNDWYGGVAYVNANAFGKPLSVDLLKEIHKRACANMAFRGYEGRRIAKRLRDGEITKDEFRALLARAYKDEPISGTNHRSLVGELRSDPIDQLAHHGNQTDMNGRRYMTEAEFQGLSKNPNLSMVPGSMTKESDGKIRAEFRYVDVAKVEATVRDVLDRTNQSIANGKSVEDKVRAIVTMQRDLLSAHPFLDGNGRTVRLLADLLYNRIGLPHPARPNERDLEMSIEEATEFVRSQMIRTLRIESGELDI